MSSNDLIALEQPSSTTAEDFRILRTNIQLGSKDKEIKTILVTSFEAGEGKSWVSSNLAVSFAQKDDRVVLVDADMRRGRQHNAFKANAKQGLADLLSSRSTEKLEYQLADYVQDTKMPNLKLITIGKYPKNPTELVLSDKMDDLIEILRTQASIVIIDGPPVTMISDSLILSSKVDGVVIVMEQGKRQVNEIKKMIRDIKKMGGNIIGIVFNKVPNTRKSYGKKSYGYTSMGSTSQKRR